MDIYGETPRTFSYPLSKEILDKITSVGGAINITIYPLPVNKRANKHNARATLAPVLLALNFITPRVYAIYTISYGAGYSH